MAVEARHLNLSPSHLIPDRDMMNNPNNNQVINNVTGTAYNSQQIRYIGVPPQPTTLPENQSFYQNAKTSINNTDSGLTYNNIPSSRKRSRDNSNITNQFYNNNTTQNFVNTKNINNNNNLLPQIPSFISEDLLPQMNHYQSEIDNLLSQHTKKIRLELEERQKQQARLMVASIGENVMKKMKEKEEHIQRIGKYNFVLQERVKSLYVENQLWRDLAQSNEAAANNLRSNLEQVLAHVSVGNEERVSGGVGIEDDAESCCGSSDDGGNQNGVVEGSKKSLYDDRACKSCGVKESCVLLLPCRHLCLCSGCGSGGKQIQTCPVCNSSMTATLHVNMS